MRDLERISQIMTMLQKGWEKVPDWRFGQLIENFKRYLGTDDVFYLEDDKLKQALVDFFDLDEEENE